MKKDIQKIKNASFARRKARTKAGIISRDDLPRLCVFRSNKFISAQIVDDVKHVILLAVSEKELDDKQKKAKKTERAQLLGKVLAEKAVAKKITKVIFDRSGYRYHGRVKALADAARENGLKF